MQVGEYIRMRSCDRRFKLEYNNRAEAKNVPFAELLFSPLDPVLQQEGKQREDAWEELLLDRGLEDLTGYEAQPEDDSSTPWAEFVDELEDFQPGETAYGREIAISGRICAFDVDGRMDFVVLRWVDDRPILRVVETKASRRDKTYHRIQVGLYRLLIERHLETSSLEVGGRQLGPKDVECVVGRIDEDTDRIEDILEFDPLDLERETSDVEHLLAEDGHLVGVLETDVEELEFRLDAKFDSCVFDVHCLPELPGRSGWSSWGSSRRPCGRSRTTGSRTSTTWPNSIWRALKLLGSVAHRGSRSAWIFSNGRRRHGVRRSPVEGIPTSSR